MFCCATDEGAATRGGSLDQARPIEARAAAADDAVDAAVQDVGRASETPSRDKTPPLTQADPPGEKSAEVADDEHSVPPVDGNDEAQDTEASEHARDREPTRGQRTKKVAKINTEQATQGSRASKPTWTTCSSCPHTATRLCSSPTGHVRPFVQHSRSIP